MTALEYGIQVDQWILKLSGGTELAPAASRLAARAPQLTELSEAAVRHKADGGSRANTAAARRKRKLEALLRGSGLDTHTVQRAGCLVAKDVSLGDPDQQVLEDAMCLTFLANELAAFEIGKDDATVVDACAKVWKKMSRAAHMLAIGLEYSPRCLGCLLEAITSAEGLGATNEPMVSPRLPANAVALLRSTWQYVPQDGFGMEFMKRACDEEPSLTDVFDCPVARPDNLAKVVQMLLDQAEIELVPRLERLSHGIAALSSKFGNLRMSHMAPIKRALVRTIVAFVPGNQKASANKAWESFFYAIAAVAAPHLVLSENLTNSTHATAASLPTPGGGPLAGLVAAHGIGLLEMSLGIGALSAPQSAPTDLMSKLAEARSWLVGCVRDDVNAYCGLLSSVYARSLGGDEEQSAAAAAAREAEYRSWLRRATEVPLRVAEVTTGAGVACLPYKKQIKHSLRGDWIAGVKLLRTAVEISRKNISINAQDGGRVASDLEVRVTRLRDMDPPWEDLGDI